jgi:hypothetical protein
VAAWFEVVLPRLEEAAMSKLREFREYNYLPWLGIELLKLSKLPLA